MVLPGGIFHMVGLRKDSKKWQRFKQVHLDKWKDMNYSRDYHDDFIEILKDLEFTSYHEKSFYHQLQEEYDDAHSWSDHGVWGYVRKFVMEHCCFGSEQYYADNFFYHTLNNGPNGIHEDPDRKGVFGNDYGVFVSLKRIIYTTDPQQLILMDLSDNDNLLLNTETEIIPNIKSPKHYREGTPEFDDMYKVVRQIKK